MNILFLGIGMHENIAKQNIYPDLLREFRDNGHSVYIACSRERRENKATMMNVEDGMSVLRIKIGNISKTNYIEKGISTILLQNQYIAAIKKYFSCVRFDIIIYSTPPITFESVIRFVKRRDGAKSYLLLKDIFPQNAVDLGVLRSGGLLYRYFRNKEKKLYTISDYIGCMSPANVNYLIKNNPYLDSTRVEECPNSIRPKTIAVTEEVKHKIREKYGIPEKATFFLYGGNLGKPQGIDSLIECINSTNKRKDVFFLIVGSGTEVKTIEAALNENHITNAKLLDFMEKNEYEQLANCADVGLVFLNKNFTIPNFPSRILSYMQASIPILAVTDTATDLGTIMQSGNFGKWAACGDIDTYLKCIGDLSNQKIRAEMGYKARKYLEANYTANRGYQIIIKHFI